MKEWATEIYCDGSATASELIKKALNRREEEGWSVYQIIPFQGVLDVTDPFTRIIWVREKEARPEAGD